MALEFERGLALPSALVWPSVLAVESELGLVWPSASVWPSALPLGLLELVWGFSGSRFELASAPVWWLRLPAERDSVLRSYREDCNRRR